MATMPTIAEADELTHRLAHTPPNDPDTVFNLGVDAVREGREEQGLPLLKAAAESHPRDHRLWQMLGLLHRGLEDLEPATAALKRAAALAPGDALVAHGLARATLEAGLPAASLFRRASALAPSDGNILLGVAAADVAEGRPQAAMDGIDALLVQHPGWLPGHALVARLRWMFGQRDGFTASFERALATAPRDTNLWREYLITLMHAGQYEATLAAIARGRALAGPHLLFDANEAICTAEMGLFAEADRLFAKMGPVDDISVAVRHVRHLLRSGRPQEAAATAEPLVAKPASDLLWPYLSVAWRLTGDSRWEWLEGDERFVGVYDISGSLPPLDALAERLRTVHIATHQPLEQSVRGGTQTDGPLFARVEPEIRALRSAIVAAVKTHIAQLPPNDPKHPLLRHPRAPIRFSGSWSVRLRSGGHHANHIHPAGWLSSALYVVLPDEAQRGPAPAGWLSLGEPQAELGIDLPPVRLVEPKPGRLVLFPSTMWHGTRPFAEGERMTVAFDVAKPR